MLPTIGEIKRAISNPCNINIPELQGYKPLPGILGPEQYSGGFSVVFPLSNGKDKKALRVWHKEIPEIKKRTLTISSYISSLEYNPYFVNYKYINDGLMVQGNRLLDVVLMDWIEGNNLKDYINTIVHAPIDMFQKHIKLKKLLENFLLMFSFLHRHKISHGDLQHGNVVVNNSDNLILLDYDSLYVPTMGKSISQVTTGLSGYQHPLRKQSAIADETNDYFSELIIVTSILSIIEDIEIWDDFNLVQDDYSLVFSWLDYNSFEDSKAYKRLYGKSDTLSFLLNEISNSIKLSNINHLKPIEEILKHLGINFTNAESLYCINCGQKFESDDVFCTNCGNKRILA